MPTLYEDLKAAGIPLDNHETDLYCLDTPEARAIIEQHGKTVDGWNVQRFTSQIDGRPWLDIVFGYDPAWQKKGAR